MGWDGAIGELRAAAFPPRLPPGAAATWQHGGSERPPRHVRCPAAPPGRGEAAAVVGSGAGGLARSPPRRCTLRPGGGRAGGGESGAAQASSARAAAAGARRPVAPGTRGGRGGGCVRWVQALPRSGWDPAPLRLAAGRVGCRRAAGKAGGCAGLGRPRPGRDAGGIPPAPPLRKILAPVALMSASPPSPFHLRCPRGLLAPQQTRRARWVRCDYLIFIFFFPKWCRSCMGLPFSGQL